MLRLITIEVSSCALTPDRRETAEDFRDREIEGTVDLRGRRPWKVRWEGLRNAEGRRTVKVGAESMVEAMGRDQRGMVGGEER